MLFARQYSADRHMTARQCLGDKDHVRLHVVMVDREEFPGAAEPTLNFIGNEKTAIPAAKLCRIL